MVMYSVFFRDGNGLGYAAQVDHLPTILLLTTWSHAGATGVGSSHFWVSEIISFVFAALYMPDRALPLGTTSCFVSWEFLNLK